MIPTLSQLSARRLLTSTKENVTNSNIGQSAGVITKVALKDVFKPPAQRMAEFADRQFFLLRSDKIKTREEFCKSAARDFQTEGRGSKPNKRVGLTRNEIDSFFDYLFFKIDNTPHAPKALGRLWDLNEKKMLSFI